MLACLFTVEIYNHWLKKVCTELFCHEVTRTRAKLAHIAGAYPSFLSMKLSKSIATPPGWDTSPSRLPPSILWLVPICTPGWREAM